MTLAHTAPAEARGAAADARDARASGGLWLPALTLWRREVVRFLRQRSRIVGALGSPLLFWIVIGSGIGTSFRPANDPSGSGYLRYFFPGTLVLIVFFTAIFATISVIEDRKEGFLQAVLVAPVPRAAIVLGKILGGTTLAWLQGALFLALGPLVGIAPSPAQWPLVLGALALVAFGLTCLGFVIAWSMESIQGFHAIMNLVLIPLWLLSGALFPPSGASGWIRAVMAANPVTYGVAALRRTLDPAGVPDDVPGLALSFGVAGAFAAVMFAACVALAHRRTGGGGT